MDENASRAIFLGVSVLVAIITLTVIINFYFTAKETAGVANRYDITIADNVNINRILSKEEITGIELRYLLNYYYGDEDVKVYVYQQESNPKNIAIDTDEEYYWSDEYQKYLDQIIHPNFNYILKIKSDEKSTKIIAIFEN